MITNRPAIDWLTLTTFKNKNARIMDKILVDMIGLVDVVECKNLQYEGVRGDGFFVGEGTQNGNEHFMFRFSGDLSDQVMFNPLRPPLDCSRLDLQITIPLPDDFDNTVGIFTDAERTVTAVEKERNVGSRKVNCITGSDGLCTLYVGSRKSEKLYRIYIKEVDGRLWLRFEIEYKGKNGMAGKALRKITKDPTEATRLIAGEIGTLPKHELFDDLKKHIESVQGDIMPYTKRVEDDRVTLAWITRQVLPAFMRVMGNEDTRDRATLLLEELIKFREGVEVA